MENKHKNIKFCNKKCPIEKVQTGQNATVNEVEKLRQVRQVKLRGP